MCLCGAFLQILVSTCHAIVSPLKVTVTIAMQEFAVKDYMFSSGRISRKESSRELATSVQNASPALSAQRWMLVFSLVGPCKGFRSCN